MATNEVFREGDSLTLPVTASTAAGSPVKVGMLVGVALTDADSSDNATVRLKGVYDLEVTGEVTAVGQLIYISDEYALTTASSDAIFGHALETKTADAANIPVRIAQGVTIDTTGA